MPTRYRIFAAALIVLIGVFAYIKFSDNSSTGRLNRSIQKSGKPGAGSGFVIPSDFTGGNAVDDPSVPMVTTDNCFFVYKVNQDSAYDMAIGGDSRTLEGISPGAIKQVLGDIRIFNFGFRGICWTPEYIASLDHLIDPASPRRAVLLILSPVALTVAQKETNDFIDVSRLKPSQRMEILNGGPLARVFSLESPVREDSGEMIYHRDGWVAVQRDRSPQKVLERFRNNFHYPVSEEIVGNLLKQISTWKKNGVEVYGLRPPTSEAMANLENELTGYNGETFAKRFTAAGGTWLEPDAKNLSWCDGHHLDVESAITYSTRIAKAIKSAKNGG